MPSKERVERYLEKGRCPTCGKVNERAPTYFSCLECSIYRTKHAKDNPEATRVWKERYEKEKRPALLNKRVEEGRCYTCGRPLTMGEETKSCRLCNDSKSQGEFNFTWN